MKKILNIYLEIDVTLILFLKSRISRIKAGSQGGHISSFIIFKKEFRI